MRLFFLLTALFFQIGYLQSYPNSDIRINDQLQSHGSHNLLTLKQSNNNIHRNVRCTPCEQNRDFRRPISNHLNPEYRGNGADNLGYDWSPKAWGGLAFPRKSKGFVGSMRERDGKQMPGDWKQNPESIHVVCDTCRTYWEGNKANGGSEHRGRDGEQQYPIPGNQNFYGRQPSYWQAGRMMTPQDYETRVSSPTVGVLVKPGSRIAYIPSRSGEMYWDGVSGGGTRWDGFSNGISWIGSGAPQWDRNDVEPSADKPEGSSNLPRPENNYQYNSNSFRPWDNQKGSQNWQNGKGYYYADGPSTQPNQIDSQWKDTGYASNWHYGSTNQNGWNGNSMKWNYGENRWPDNDRAANQFYFNSPQDRGYGPGGGGGIHLQYGNQYPNYQQSSGYPGNFKQHSWRPNQGFRVNDRDPSGFQQGYPDDKNRPWDYTSERFDYKKPSFRPEWEKPGLNHPDSSIYDKPGSTKYPDRGYFNNKYPNLDKNDYDKPWNSRPSYMPAKPDSGSNFPYGSNRYPGSSSDGGNNHLFYPNEGNQPPSYSNPAPSFGGIRPAYPSGDRPGYASGGSQPGSYQSNHNRPASKPSVIYTGEMTLGGYPHNAVPSGVYSGTEIPSGGYPSGGGSYPIRENRPGIYHGSTGQTDSYPGNGIPLGSYPGGGSRPSSYPGGGSRPDNYPGSGSRPGSYPGGGSRPDNYPGSGSRPDSYPGGASRPDGYFGGGAQSNRYPESQYRPDRYPGGGSRPDKYPSYSNRPSGYPSGGNRPEGFPGSGNRPNNYISGDGSLGGFPGGTSYPGGSNRPSGFPGGSTYPGENSRPGYYPTDGPQYPSSYPSGGSRPGGYQVARPNGYTGSSRPINPNREYSSSGAGGLYPERGKPPPKGYYTGFITELKPDNGYISYGSNFPNYFGGSYPGNKNTFSGKDKDLYNKGDSNRYPTSDKDRYPSNSGDRYYGGGGSDFSSADKNKYPNGGDRFYYYGQNGDKGKYPGGFPANHRYPGDPNGDNYDRNSGSSDDKNAWNYDLDERKDGIYRRSGGSYPPYRGGPYYTSSYLATMSTTSGSTQTGSETKTQSATKLEEVTQPTDSS